MYGGYVAIARYEGIGADDFLTALDLHLKDVRNGYFPRIAYLKELMVEGVSTQDGKARCNMYLCYEDNLVTGQREKFIIIRGPSYIANLIEGWGVALKGLLAKLGFPTLFRIDPRYGILYGSARNPVDDTIKWDKPFTFLTLYCTDDPSFTPIALYEYVSQRSIKKYEGIFEEYNRCKVKKPSFFKSAIKVLKGSQIVDNVKIPYSLILSIIKFSGQSFKWKDTLVSVIFKDIPDSDLRRIILDSSRCTVIASGGDRFFASLGELSA